MNMISPRFGENMPRRQQSLSHYRPDFDMDMVQRLLGRRRRRHMTRTTGKRLTTYRRPVLDRLRPRVTWKVYDITACTGDSIALQNGGNTARLGSRKMAASLKGADKLVCFVATIGAGIDKMIEAFGAKGSIADAYVIDALASGAIENTAQRFQDDFIHRLSRRSYVAGLRFSPGYCDWSIGEQNTLFSLLDCENIGVSLSDTALMNPRKSISAVFGLYDPKRAPRNLDYNPCSRCGKGDCIARRSSGTAATPAKQHHNEQ